MTAKFSLKIFSPHFVNDVDVDLFNRIYREWKIIFKEVVESKGGILDPDDFFRNDHVVAIVNEIGDLVASCTLTLFDCRLFSTREHHYFKALSSDLPRELTARGVNRIYSIEYLNVLPEWRKTHSQVPWVEVIIGSVLKLMDVSCADAVIGTPRIDAKVIDSCLNLEGQEIHPPISKMSYPCAVVLFPKTYERVFANTATAQYVHQLMASLEQDIRLDNLSYKIAN